jgi:hypothetical protein
MLIRRYIKSPVIIDNTRKYIDFVNSYIYLTFSINLKQVLPDGINKLVSINGIPVNNENQLDYVTYVHQFVHSQHNVPEIVLLPEIFDLGVTDGIFNIMNTSCLIRTSTMNNDKLYVIIRYKINNEGNVHIEQGKTITHIKIEIEQNSHFIETWNAEKLTLHSISSRPNCTDIINVSYGDVAVVESDVRYRVSTINETPGRGSVNPVSIEVNDGANLTIELIPAPSLTTYTNVNGTFVPTVLEYNVIQFITINDIDIEIPLPDEDGRYWLNLIDIREDKNIRIAFIAPNMLENP